MRIRLYEALVISTLTYGSSAWLLTDEMKRKINGVNSKMLSQITHRTIHEEAKDPSFDIIDHVLKRRGSYLGHILRLEDSRIVRRFLLELSPDREPFIPGTLLADTPYRNIDEICEVAADRERWKAAWRSRHNTCR